jgi:2-polyprenyl-3-methyl-5-hydroxy-6-metoxy-1,4-benzoquinol methylase
MQTPTNSSAAAGSSYYDAYWRDRFDAALFERRIRTFHKNYARHLPVSRDARFIEIGPGYGEMLEFLARAGFTRLAALDNDAPLIEALRRRGVRAEFHVDDAIEFLMGRPGQFDGVVAMHVLEHFDGPSGRALVEAAFSALAPGGRIILEVPNMANFITAPYARWADYTHRHGYTIESLSALLLTAGFRIHAAFGVARSIGSPGQFVGHVAQRCTDAFAWLLLKANYPRVDIVAAPVIGIVGERPGEPAGTAA